MLGGVIFARGRGWLQHQREQRRRGKLGADDIAALALWEQASDTSPVRGAIKEGSRWVTNGPLEPRADLSLSGDNLTVPVQLAGSSLLSLRQLERQEAKQHYLPKHDWIAVVAHDVGELTIATDLEQIRFLATILRWRPPNVASVDGGHFGA
jgi:hypothetical protein